MITILLINMVSEFLRNTMNYIGWLIPRNKSKGRNAAAFPSLKALPIASGIKKLISIFPSLLLLPLLTPTHTQRPEPRTSSPSSDACVRASGHLLSRKGRVKPLGFLLKTASGVPTN